MRTKHGLSARQGLELKADNRRAGEAVAGGGGAEDGGAKGTRNARQRSHRGRQVTLGLVLCFFVCMCACMCVCRWVDG